MQVFDQIVPISFDIDQNERLVMQAQTFYAGPDGLLCRLRTSVLQGQTVSGINESDARLCPLAPGEATFHHGWTLHASMPNRSADRRIGLNVQYLATHVRQTKHDQDTAMLVRGRDDYGHFE